MQKQCKVCQASKYQEHRYVASCDSVQIDDTRVHEWFQDQANEKVLEELIKVNDRIDRVLNSVQLLDKKLEYKRSRHNFLVWAVVAIAFTGWKVR